VVAQGDSLRDTLEALYRLEMNIRNFAHFLVLCENNARTYEHNEGRLRCERLCEEVRQAQAFLLNNARRRAWKMRYDAYDVEVQNEARESGQTHAVNDIDDGGMASATAAKTADDFAGLFADLSISRISGILEELAQKQLSDDEASPTLVLGQAFAELDALSAFAETCFFDVLNSARDVMAKCPRERYPHDALLKCCLWPLRSRWLAVAKSYVKEIQNKAAEAAARELVEGDEASASKKAAAIALSGVGGSAEGGDDDARRSKAAAKKEKKREGEQQRKRQEASTCASEAAAAAAAAAADDAKRKAELEAKRVKEEEEYDAMLARRAQEIADKEAEQERRRRQEFEEEKRRKEEEKKREEDELKLALKRSKEDAKRAEKQRREQEKKQAALDAAAAEAQASQPPSQEGARTQRPAPAPANDAAIEARMQAQLNIFGDDASRMGLSAGARGVPPARPQPYRPPGAPGSMVTPPAAADAANVTSVGGSSSAAAGVTGMPPFWLNTGASVLPSQPSPLPWLSPPAPPAQPMSSFLPPAPPSAIVAPSAPSAATEGGAAAGTGLSNATGEYNCFLNSIVQSLYRCRCFRQHLANARVASDDVVPGHPLFKDIAVVLALKDLCQAVTQGVVLRRDAQQQQPHVMAPTTLRVALAALSQTAGAGEAAVNEMADATEVLSIMFECFQRVSQYNRARMSEAAAAQLGVAPITRMFSLSVREQIYCRKCRRPSHVLAYESFFQIVASTALRYEHPRWASFEDTLHHIITSDTKGCDTDFGGCGEQKNLEHELVRAPKVFTIALSWATGQASEADVQDTMAALPEVIHPMKIYRTLGPASPLDAGPDVPYQLRAMVCYYGSHYACYARDDERPVWTRYDDANVNVVGDWGALRAACAKGHLQPTVLFYESTAWEAP
jgi:chemotaxis protein histidine kinase CheA